VLGIGVRAPAPQQHASVLKLAEATAEHVGCPGAVAAHDMIQYTSTRGAPWILVEGDDKHYARLKVIDALVEHLEQKLAKD